MAARDLDHQRALLDDARFELRRAAVGAAEALDALETASRDRGAGDQGAAAVARATRAVETAKAALADARKTAAAQKGALAVDLGAWLAPSPEAEVGRLSADVPLVLLPVRLETRFEGNTLLLRVYPDDILGDTFEPELSDDEIAAGRAFWEAAWPGEPEERAAWKALVGGSDAGRAAWVVQAMEPVNLATRPSGAPQFPTPSRRESSWTRPAEARLLPDRWHVLLQRKNGERIFPSTKAIVEPLALTFSPDPGDARSPLEPDGLKLDDDVRWTVDFERAVDVGMALRIPLEGDEVEGLRRVIVFGVKSSLPPDVSAKSLAELLEHHRYGRGVALVPQGTPTNNTSAAATPFPPPDPEGARSFALERAAAPAPLAPGRDGPRLATALGLDAGAVSHLDAADGRENERAGAMARALWSVTWGYFLGELMSPVVGATGIDAARRFFVNHVRGRGPYSAFRIGNTPYGVLPASSLSSWQAGKTRGPDAALDAVLPEHLRTLRVFWLSRTENVPRVGRSADPDLDLLEVLGVDASTREVRIRPVMGEDATWNLMGIWGWSDVWTQWLDAGQAIANQIFTALGHPEWRPRVSRVNFDPKAWPFRYHLVTENPVSETDGLAPNYIAWLRGASVPELASETLPAGWQRPVSLLYRLLRHAALLEFQNASSRLALRAGLIAGGDGAERELYGLASMEGKLNRVQQMKLPIEGVTGDQPVHQFLAQPANAATIAALLPDEPVVGLRDALGVLSGAPTAELERLTGETLDTCSHRLDAWITALASKRLEQMRAAKPEGCHLGAFGWVEDLEPRAADSVRPAKLRDGRSAAVQLDSGGHVHSPSMIHAAAAAVLRNGYLSRAGEDRKRYAVDLSSARVRAGRFVLDAVREGQPLGAVLGYQVERALHDGNLDRYIDPLRARYPLVAAKTGDPEDLADPTDPNDPDRPKDHIAARNVVDGLALRQAFTDQSVPWGSNGLPDAATSDGQKIAAILKTLEATVDAVSDLLLAEGVYQLVKGSPGVAAATLDAMAQGSVRPPDPEIATQPRRGTPLTHRIAVFFDGAAALPAGYAAVSTPRAAIEPGLDAWLGSLFGPAAAYVCTVAFGPPAAPTATRPVSLAELGVRPIDVLALARASTERAADANRAAASELDRRVLEIAHAKAGLVVETPANITYGRPAGAFDPTVERTFVDLLELAGAAAAVLAGSRALGPQDLVAEDREDDAKAADHRAVDALARAASARDALANALQVLNQRITAAKAAAPGAPFPLANLRAALRGVAAVGVPGAYPRSSFGDAPEARLDLVAQADSVAAEATRRVAQASGGLTEANKPEHANDDKLRLSAATDAVAQVCSRDMPFFPTFAPPAPAELANGLAHATNPKFIDADPVRRRTAIRAFERVAGRVRPAMDVWRRLEIVAGALRRPPAPRALAQLPYEPDAAWVALPFADEAHRPKPGRTSILLYGAAAPDTTVPWSGLLLDQWTETIPLPTEQTGVAFHYDDPGAEAPQAVLVAVPPVAGAERWQLPWLLATLKETLDMAPMRAVDGELLGALGQLLPAICLADSTADVTVRSSFRDAIYKELTVLAAKGAVG